MAEECCFFFFKGEDGIRSLGPSRGLGDVYKRQLAFLIIVISIDTGAYATGLTFGKHPMAPRISPKKTWEGFAGSVAAAFIAGILLSIYMIDEPWWFGFIFGGVIVARVLFSICQFP